eukprot:FR736002.1.p1 GENE.FR736002.1~~FR736002.1.p1  ORF type:complete len:162 (+),score=15.74 FR736002.1:1-486(+)
MAEQGMVEVGKRAGVALDYNVQTNWQPVDSQRLMLWAARHGKQEVFMDKLGHMHFEQRKSASHRETLLSAAALAGLDTDQVSAFLDTDELKDQVWQSYGDTIRKYNIRAIPFLIFGLPGMGGPFRPEGTITPIIINGSGDLETFLQVLETLWERSRSGATK